MKKLELTTFERMALAQWVNQQKGDLRTIRSLIRLLDKLELSDDEERAVGFVQVDDRLMWTDQDRTFPLQLEDAEFDLLAPALEAEWQADRLILAMLEKIAAVSRRAETEEKP